jgi:transposase InsO family protein
VELPPPGTPGKSYSAGEKAAALRAYVASGQRMLDWCRSQGISTATLCAWRRAYSKGGEAALAPRKNPRNTYQGRTHPPYSPEQRREAVLAFHKSGLTQDAFSRLWGISVSSLRTWCRAYRERGPQGLEAPSGIGRRGRKKEPVPESVRAEIVATKRRFPTFGLRKMRDALARFSGLRVSTKRVSEVVKEEGLASERPAKRVRRAPPRVRRFERARPRELWQSDITSYVLTRHSQRVYLTVFLDDHSRYVVSWALALQQRSELVTECLLEGLARFGKPREVLTDQGRQYFAWRGKSRFQKLLIREGIAHVVSRAHHPQTLGKCERLWKTVGDELWSRSRPQDLEEARRRLGHFFDHYNHFRPHQGIGGLVPADRFFGAEKEARAALERAMDGNALRLALGDAPRRPVFLYGQVDGEPVSVHGERGRLVISGLTEGTAEIEMKDLGARGEHDEHEREDTVDAESERGAEPPAAASPSQASAQDAASSSADAGLVGERERGAAERGVREDGLDAGVLAGQDEQAGGGGHDGCDAASSVAAESDGDFGDGLWAAPAAALPEGNGREYERPAERSQGAAQADQEAGRGSGVGAASDRRAEVAAGECEPDGVGGEGAARGREGAQQDVATRGLLRRAQGTRPEELKQEASPPSPSTAEESVSEPWWEQAWGELWDGPDAREERP